MESTNVNEVIDKIIDFRKNELDLDYLVKNYDEKEILEMYEYGIQNEVDDVVESIMELGKSEIFKI